MVDVSGSDALSRASAIPNPAVGAFYAALHESTSCRVERSTWTISRVGLVILSTGAVLAAWGTSVSGVPSPTSSAPRVSIHPNRPTRTIPPSPSSRPATLGLRSLSSSKDDGMQLNVLSGLENDSPIFDGDFADPFALPPPTPSTSTRTNTVNTQVHS